MLRSARQPSRALFTRPLLVLDTVQRALLFALAVGVQRLSALAGRVVAANKRVLWWQARLRAAREVAAAAAAERASASAAATRRAKLARLGALAQRGAADAQFLAMLRSLDDSHTALEHKWAAMARHVAREADFRRHTEELFRMAGESSAAVQDAGAAGAALLKGAHKRAVVQHEEALKRHVFAQMLQHGAPPRAA